jgi:hypothetical protein
VCCGVDRVTYINARAQGVDYDQLIQAANRAGKVPAGKRIVTTILSWPGMQIRLEPAIPGTQIEARPVPVPTRITRYHPVVAQFRDRHERHELSKQHLPRALLILQALAIEAERRGLIVALPDDQTGTWTRHSWRASRDGHLTITADGQGQSIRLSEIGMPSRSGWNRSHSYSSRDTYYSNTGTGRLRIELAGYGGGRESRG